MTPEQRQRYIEILRHPPYPECRNTLFHGVSEENKRVCAIGALYHVTISDIFTTPRLITDDCVTALGLTQEEMCKIIVLNHQGGFSAVIDWLETDVFKPEYEQQYRLWCYNLNVIKGVRLPTEL